MLIYQHWYTAVVRAHACKTGLFNISTRIDDWRCAYLMTWSPVLLPVCADTSSMVSELCDRCRWAFRSLSAVQGMVRAEASWNKIFAVAVPSILLNGKNAVGLLLM